MFSNRGGVRTDVVSVNAEYVLVNSQSMSVRGVTGQPVE